MGAVVHAYEGDGKSVAAKAFVYEGNHLSQVAFGCGRPFLKIGCNIRQQFAFAVYQAVALFCNGEAGHFQGGGAENLLQASIFPGVGAVQDQGFHNTAHYRFLHGSVGLQGDEDTKIVVGTVHFFNDFIVIAFCGDQAGAHNALIQEALGNVCLEGTENIARAEVNPFRGFQGALCSSGNIKLRKIVAGSLPAFLLQESFLC